MASATAQAAQGAFDLPAGGTVIGRAADADIRLDDPTVSGHHVLLTLQNPGSRKPAQLQALPEAGPLRVNGQAVRRTRLNSGARIEVGDVVLIFEQELDDNDPGRQGGGPHRDQLSADDLDHGATSGLPLGTGPFRQGLRRTSRQLWLAVALITAGAVLCGAALVAADGSNLTAYALLGVGLFTGMVGIALARRGHIFDDVT